MCVTKFYWFTVIFYKSSTDTVRDEYIRKEYDFPH